jgi:hypothetical protein
MQRLASLEDQKRTCTKDADGSGWVVLEDHCYTDAAKTGTSKHKREGFKALLKALEKKPKPRLSRVGTEQQPRRELYAPGGDWPPQLDSHRSREGRTNVLDISAFKHYRINHTRLFADRQTHINGIENFWNQAKRHMRKFNGVPKSHFPLF